MNNISQVLESLWLSAANNPELLTQVRISVSDSVLPSSFKVTTAATASIAATALMAATLWQTKTGHKQTVTIDTRRVNAAFRSERYMRLNQQPLHTLLEQADIFVQGYRPGGLAEPGFSSQQLAAQYPGLIYVSLSAYSHKGPWANRHGYNSLVQSASGIAWQEGQAAGLDQPQHLPAQALDHATGYIAAYAAMVALKRRAEEGGSWLVRISLAQTGRWCTQLGLSEDINKPDLNYDEIADLLQTSSTPFDEISHVMPGAVLSDTPAYWQLPAVPLGAHAPSWN